MTASRWIGVVVAGLMAAGACQREDVKGAAAGDEEGVIPAGAIPAPTQGGVDNTVLSAPPSAGTPAADTAAPTGAAPAAGAGGTAPGAGGTTPGAPGATGAAGAAAPGAPGATPAGGQGR